MREIKSKVARDRAYLDELRVDESMREVLSSISRMIAMMMFIQESYKNLAPLTKLVTRYGRDVIIEGLLRGYTLEKVNPFLLDDVLILPIS
jgi:hypothetical protein